MNFKLEELNKPSPLHPVNSFLESKDDFDKSEVFKLLKRLPKGAALLGYDSFLVSSDFVVKELTYMDNLFILLDRDNNLESLKFFANPPSEDWDNVQKLRGVFGIQEGKSFDDWLISHITLGESNIGLDVNTVWRRLTGIFVRIMPMLTYEPAWCLYFYQTLQEFHEDNVSYLEFYGTLPELYRLDGTILDEVQVCQLYVDTLRQFKMKNPTFLGARLIYAPLGFVNEHTIKIHLRVARILKDTFPDFIAGFGLVGYENLGQNLVNFSEDLLELQCDMNFYFHAGATNWRYDNTDDILVDAVLLGTKRIGNGISLIKHPKLAQIVKEKQIGLEISPISNQVFGLVQDLRNHPGNHLLVFDNYPVVISPYGPGLWGVKGASYDWCEAFMCMATRWQDLRLLKQLAMNSIQQTSLEIDQKEMLFTDWNHRWNSFIDEINKSIIKEKADLE